MSPPDSTPFGVAWQDLKLADLRAFLKTNPPERANWEAKGHDEKAKLKRFIREECCGLANRNGGYLVLGASEIKGSGWKLLGIEVPKVREIYDWVSSLLRELDPVPPFDVVEWKLRNGRTVVVVKVEVCPIPPVTVNGTVFLRHGTQTLKASGSQISSLAKRGQRARDAKEKATQKVLRAEAKGLFVPFSLGIGVVGERDIELSDPAPEQVAYRRLLEALKRRWPKRDFSPLQWGGDRQLVDAEDFVFVPPTDPGYSGWRAGWEMNDKAQNDRYAAWLQRARVQSRSGAKRREKSPELGERDLFLMAISADRITTVTPMAMPGPGDHHRFDGMKAISLSKTLFGALSNLEIDLGTPKDEVVYLSIAHPSKQATGPVVVGDWIPLCSTREQVGEMLREKLAMKMLLL